jgi:hypothetical protein
LSVVLKENSSYFRRKPALVAPKNCGEFPAVDRPAGVPAEVKGTLPNMILNEQNFYKQINIVKGTFPIMIFNYYKLLP